MATLALKPAFPIRTRSSGSKRDQRNPRERRASRSRLWRAISIMAGALVLTFFSVLAPMIGDPAGRLFALDTTSTILAEGGGDAWSARAFEFTPTMLGPAITDDALALIEDDTDSVIVTMPELEVHARPPTEEGEPTPPG
jgi:hypothetical protein